jgi:hypothetical protein
MRCNYFPVPIGSQSNQYSIFNGQHKAVVGQTCPEAAQSAGRQTLPEANKAAAGQKRPKGARSSVQQTRPAAAQAAVV